MAKGPPGKQHQGAAKGQPHFKLVAKNRRALFDYHVESRHEAGLQLTGTEVKSLRAGKLQLSDAYAVGQRGELVLQNADIARYDPAGPLQNHAPKRTRKLLLHRREIDKLLEAQQRSGYALIPLSVYFKDGKAKVELGLCKGKQNFDKREAIAERDAKRDLDRTRRQK
jgi:SsrA-binding protein